MDLTVSVLEFTNLHFSIYHLDQSNILQYLLMEPKTNLAYFSIHHRSLRSILRALNAFICALFDNVS